jgi:DNA polymerase V
MSEGLFGIQRDYSKKVQSLDERFVINSESTFFFEQDSDAMSPYILQGDILIVDRSLDWLPGKIVLCFYDGQMLCRRIVEERGGLLLRAENSQYRDIALASDQQTTFFGVVRSIGRDIE